MVKRTSSSKSSRPSSRMLMKDGSGHLAPSRGCQMLSTKEIKNSAKKRRTPGATTTKITKRPALKKKKKARPVMVAPSVHRGTTDIQIIKQKYLYQVLKTKLA